ncbi:MAG: hypothetical protein IJ808_06460, partial [Muribaculaceae bacterium]|nr:hypothetical protein [Muribaculaceae bacterium]
MKRRCRLYIIIFLAVSSIGTHAQQRVVSEVRKNINELTVSIDNLKSAINKIKPALLNGDTKDRAETWYVAGCAQYRLYDKYVANRNVGKKVDVKAMGHALIDGFDCYETSLRLDTLREVNKDGSLKIDKKTGLPKWRTKYSKDIIDRYAAHWSDYNRMGGELYNLKDWQGAYQAWDIYCQLAARLEKQRSLAVADSSLAQARFFQGIAKWQQADHRQAVAHFEQARQMGYHKKEAYDYALVCLSSLGDEQAIIATAREAYAMFGVSDLQYARILINDQINKKQYVAADTLLTVAIEARPDDAELQ